MSTEQRSILITGCSSGFGKLTAQALATHGDRVFASMRDPKGKNAGAANELTTWAEQGSHALEVLELDVTNAASVTSAVEHVEARAGALDVLVNNAGVAGLGLLECYRTEQLQRLFDVNVFGVQRMCRAVLPRMRARGRGQLVFVSSAFGRVVMPCLGAYISSKFALEALAESYAYELAPSGIDVTIVEPGTFPTAIGDNMAGWSPDDADRAPGYGRAAELPGHMLQGIVAILSNPSPPDPHDVSNAIVDAVTSPATERPRRIVVDELSGQGVEAINATSSQIQTAALEGAGLGWLLPNSKPSNEGSS